MALAPVTSPLPTPRPEMLGAGGGAGPLAGIDPMTLAAILGAIQVPEQQRQPLPQTTFPEVPRAMNPAFSQMVMQAMQGGPQAQTGTLGALLRGIGG